MQTHWQPDENVMLKGMYVGDRIGFVINLWFYNIR